MNQLPPAKQPKRDVNYRPKARQPKRKNPYEAPKGKRGVASWLGRLLLFFVALTLCGAASLLLFLRWQQAEGGGRITVEGGDINLGTVEQIYLEGYLATRADQLAEPAGSGTATVAFVIDSGQTANDITANLQANGLVTDTTLFLNYVKYYGLDAQLEAGTYDLTPQMTIPEIATRLTRSQAEEIELRFLEGWRAEEMADYLAAVQPANIDSQQFLAIVQRKQLFDLTPYVFMSSHPEGASLEGFLFPDTYRVPLDADAAYLVGLMLNTFGTRVTPTMRQLIGAQGLSLREAITLASIVEREGVLNAERATIASVFYNRLELGMKLEADPTIQYAVGFDAVNNSWWKSPLFQSDLDLDSPYNSYLYPGLPPSPIANPGLSSIRAVAEPAQTQFIFFVADCSGEAPGSHNFSQTYDQHLAFVLACR